MESSNINNITCSLYEEEEEPVIITLDQTCLSIPLRSKLEEQRKLHLQWVSEMECFNSKALVIPLEYCVRPNKSMWSALKEYVGKTQSKASKKQVDPGQEPKKRKTGDIEIDSLSTLPLELRNNREYMMDRVKENGMFLYYAHPDLLFDTDLLLEAIRKHGDSFKYVPTALRTDEIFVRKALSANGDAFCYLNKQWRGRIDLFEIAMKTSGKIFLVADENIKSFSYAMQCISKHWQVIYHFEPETPNYSVLIELIIKGGFPYHELVNSNLISCLDILLRYLDISNQAFLMAKEEITLDEAIINKVLNRNLSIASYLTPSQLNVIVKNNEMINRIVKHPEVKINMHSALLIIHNSSPENVKLLILKYPQYHELLSDISTILDPFILRYYSVVSQFITLFNQKHDLLSKSKKKQFENMGYLISNDAANINNLKKRFEITHPGLVIPWHRFRDLSANIFTIQDASTYLNDNHLCKWLTLFNHHNY